MGHLFLPSSNRPIPPGAEIINQSGERTARWRDRRGKLRTAEVRSTPKGDQVVIPGARYLARYKDGLGETRTVPTDCKDESAARAVLVELERRAEMVRSGILTPAQDAAADERKVGVEKHLDRYLQSLRAKGDTERHVRNVRRLVTMVFTACKFRTLGDVKREAVERWLASGDKAARSARTRNMYLAACKWFMGWAVENEILFVNPLARIKPADENGDRRRQPRALSAEEVQRLLDAAQRRPLAEARLFNRGWRRGQPGARLRAETVTKLDLLGRERALIYKTLVLTGLRLGELRSIRICDVILDDQNPRIVLDPRNEKNRQGSQLPLRDDLRRDLTAWIGNGRGEPQRTLFAVSPNLVKVFDRDLRFARIEKRDDRNRTACVHSLRHTFATLMSRGGVAPRVAQAAMRHASLEMTMSVYTDPRLLDVARALSVLPELPLETAAMADTGT